MTFRHLFSISTSSPDGTDQLAADIAPKLGPGDVLLLRGPVGAGKTHFARKVIQTIQAKHGPIEDVPSPTFTLVQTYRAGTTEIWHADLYRLGSEQEIEELGLSDAFLDAICIVEWPELLDRMRPEGALEIQITYGDGADDRVFSFSGNPRRWAKISDAVTEDSKAPVPDG